MRPTTPSTPSEASETGLRSSREFALPPALSGAHRSQSQPDSVRDTVDAWPDSGLWPGSSNALSAFDLESVDEPFETWEDFAWDELPGLSQDEAFPLVSRHPSTAPQAIPIVTEGGTQPRAPSRRRRLVAAIAVVSAAPFFVLGVYALGSRGFHAWSEGTSSALAAALEDSQPAQTVSLSPEERAYRAAGDALRQAATKASTACSSHTGRVASLWVTATFAPSGHVSLVTVEGSPADRPGLSECVERIVRQSSIPPFRSDDVRVERALVIE